MRVALICAAGAQTRWERSGGKGLKQLIELGGETLIRRTHRLVSERCEIVTLVRDPDRPEWQGLNPQRPAHEPWMGEMGKFLDGRPYWPEAGEVVILYGDVFYTETCLDIIFEHEPTQPTVYGRAAGQRRLESFAFRFTIDQAPQVERIARECADNGMVSKGGPWRWFYRRHTGGSDYSSSELRKFATEANGWVELPPDATDDFDKTDDLRRWRAEFAAPRTVKGKPMRYAKRDLYVYDGPVRRLAARAGRRVPDRFVPLLDENDMVSRPGAAARAAVPSAPAELATDASGVGDPEAKATPETAQEEAPDYSTLKQPQLKELLKERGIDYPSGPVKNADLVDLLEAADRDDA